MLPIIMRSSILLYTINLDGKYLYKYRKNILLKTE